MTETWTISASGRVYGPYSAQQMKAFVSEGRLAPHSLIAKSGKEIFGPASEDPDIAQYFAPPEKNERPIQAAPAASPAAAPDTAPRFGRSETEDKERSHFIIIADMKSGSVSALEEEIFNLGHAYPIQPQAWVLASDKTLNEIRNTLMQRLGKLDMLFLADASHDKAAWFNFGPESDVKLRRIWQKPHEQIRRAV